MIHGVQFMVATVSLMPVISASLVFWWILLGIALIGTASSTVFLMLVIVAAIRYSRNSRAARAAADATPERILPPVTVLKPIHGMEASLERNLESFFRQDYPSFEVVFGARDAQDPALQVAERVRQRYPHVPSQIVVSGPPPWPNAKVFSLDKMLRVARNSYLILSDSDVEVGPDLLRSTIPSLLDPKIGLVTCPYRGVPAPGLGSTLEALGMSIEMPSGVMVADMLEGMRFALGPCVATRREVLDAIGGISSTADYYSDDFVLGNLAWLAGYRIIFSHYVVGHVLSPRPFWRTLGDQLRWMKSTRYSRPKGHLGTGLTFAMPFGLLGLLAASVLGNFTAGLWLLAIAWTNRLIQALVVGWAVIGDSRALWLAGLYPLRDLMGFFLWVGSYASRSFMWRGEVYHFVQGGRIVPQNRPSRQAATPQS